MQLGCQSWSFRELRKGAPWDNEIKKIANLGFKGLELILCTPEEVKDYWTPANIKKVKDLYTSLGLTLTQYAMFQPAVGNLVSLDKKEREKSLDVYKQGCDIAVGLGTELVNFVSPWPIGMQAPIPYVPRYYYVDSIGGEPKFKMELPKGFNWEELCNTYVATMKECACIARERGLKLAVEGHIHVMMPHTDSFLRLADQVNDDAFGYCMDIGWQALQREFIPMSIHKVKGKLLSMHLRDIDGFGMNFVCPGLGSLDWDGIMGALKDTGFDGYFCLEFSEYPMEYRETLAKFVIEYFTPILAKYQ